jgi:hypothetical protein
MSRAKEEKTMQNEAKALGYRAHLQQQISIGRRTLLGMIVMTVVNLGLLLGDGDTYLLFSASVPYYLTWFGKAMDNGIGSLLWQKNGIYTMTGLAVSLVMLAVYLLPWFLSKKKGSWLWMAFGLLCLDLLALVGVALLVGFGSVTADLLIHIVLLYQIGKGASSYKKLKDLPPEVVFTVVGDEL